MKTLKLKHLAPYLPYKLKIMVKMGDNSWKQFELVVSDLENFEDKSSFYKPILHPLSDLTKPIKVEGYNDGKEFVPIVELLNVACIQIWGEQIIHTEEPAILSESDSCGVIAYNDTERVSFTCDFNGMEKDFVLYVDGSILKLNKLSLFKLLYQWHFAIDIPDGTWIDINTL